MSAVYNTIIKQRGYAMKLNFISEITTVSASKLKRTIFGGVSKKSAINAIEEGVTAAYKKCENELSKIQSELEKYKNKSAKEMAELTSKNDSIILETEEALKKANAIKILEKNSPNGEKEIRKLNKNGALMVKKYKFDGNISIVKVTLFDGTQRKTLYNTRNGKPVKTFIHSNGNEKVIKYDENGISELKNAVGNNFENQTPRVMHKTESKPFKDNLYGKGYVYDRIYSDGSIETVARYVNDKKETTMISTKKYSSEGKLLQECDDWDMMQKITVYEDDGSIRIIEKNKNNNTTMVTKKVKTDDDNYKVVSTKLYENGIKTNYQVFTENSDFYS